MVITRTRLVAVVSFTAITTGLGVLCVLKIIELKTIIEIVVSACAHNGLVAVSHGLVTKPVLNGH